MKTRGLVEKQPCRDMRRATCTDAGVVCYGFGEVNSVQAQSAQHIRMSAHFNVLLIT
jgi:hypothetical protein